VCAGLGRAPRSAMQGRNPVMAAPSGNPCLYEVLPLGPCQTQQEETRSWQDGSDFARRITAAVSSELPPAQASSSELPAPVPMPASPPRRRLPVEAMACGLALALIGSAILLRPLDRGTAAGAMLAHVGTAFTRKGGGDGLVVLASSSAHKQSADESHDKIGQIETPGGAPLALVDFNTSDPKALEKLKLGKRYALSVLAPRKLKTDHGCTCEENWSYKHYDHCASEANGWCCNPNSQKGGNWCFTKGTCHGHNWDHCKQPFGDSDALALLGPENERLVLARVASKFTGDDPIEALVRGGAELTEEGPIRLLITERLDLAPFTTQGCTCAKEAWSYKGRTCASRENGWCCDPDEGEEGPWCATEGSCQGRAWDHCEPAPPSHGSLKLSLPADADSDAKEES